MVAIMTPEQLSEFAKSIAAEVLSAAPVQQAKPPVEIISPDELCKRLDISIVTQIRWRKKGKLPFMTIGSRIRYDWNAVVDALKKNR